MTTAWVSKESNYWRVSVQQDNQSEFGLGTANTVKQAMAMLKPYSPSKVHSVNDYTGSYNEYDGDKLQKMMG